MGKKPVAEKARVRVPSRPPRTEEEARAFAEALVCRDRKLLESLVKRGD